MAATKKKDFKQGVDYFLSNEVDNEQKVATESRNTGHEERNSLNVEDSTYASTDEYAHTYNDVYTDAHVNILARPLPARPKGERKTRRLNLLVRPSMYNSLSAIASQSESSVNDLINNVLEDFVTRSVKKEM